MCVAGHHDERDVDPVPVESQLHPQVGRRHRESHSLPGPGGIHRCRDCEKSVRSTTLPPGPRCISAARANRSYVILRSDRVARVKPGCAFFQNSVWVMHAQTSPVFFCRESRYCASVQSTTWRSDYASGVVGIILWAQSGDGRNDFRTRSHLRPALYRRYERANDEYELQNAGFHETPRIDTPGLLVGRQTPRWCCQSVVYPARARRRSW